MAPRHPLSAARPPAGPGETLVFVVDLLKVS
jgi:hypothetical protein